MTFTFPEVGEAPGAEDAHELHLHVVGVGVARLSQFLTEEEEQPIKHPSGAHSHAVRRNTPERRPRLAPRPRGRLLVLPEPREEGYTSRSGILFLLV